MVTFFNEFVIIVDVLRFICCLNTSGVLDTDFRIKKHSDDILFAKQLSVIRRFSFNCFLSKLLYCLMWVSS